MKVLERVVVIIIIGFFIAILPFAAAISITSFSTANTVKTIVEEALSKICMSAQITSLEYEQLVDAVVMAGYSGELKISSSYYELGSDGTKHLTTITTSEIVNELEVTGVFDFTDNTYVSISVVFTRSNLAFYRRIFDYRHDFIISDMIRRRL